MTPYRYVPCAKLASIIPMDNTKRCTFIIIDVRTLKKIYFESTKLMKGNDIITLFRNNILIFI